MKWFQTKDKTLKGAADQTKPLPTEEITLQKKPEDDSHKLGHANRGQRVKKLETGYNQLLTLTASIEELLGSQSVNQENLLTALEELPNVTEGLQKIGEAATNQTSVLSLMQTQLSTNAQIDKELIGSMNRFNTTLLAIDQKHRRSSRIKTILLLLATILLIVMFYLVTDGFKKLNIDDIINPVSERTEQTASENEPVTAKKINPADDSPIARPAPSTPAETINPVDKKANPDLPAEPKTTETTDSPLTENSPPANYMARVNNSIITKDTVAALMTPLLKDLELHFTGAELEQKKEEANDNALNALIVEVLMMEEARAQNIIPTPEALHKEADLILQTQFNGDEALRDRQLASENKTYENWMNMLSDQLGAHLLYKEQVLRKAQVSETQLQEEYEKIKDDLTLSSQIKLSEIRVDKGETFAEQFLNKDIINAAYEQIVSGEEFSQVAQSLSQSSTAQAGGVLPWKNQEELAPELLSIVTNLAIHETSAVIPTKTAYYILHIDDLRPATQPSFEDVSSRIKKRMLEAEREKLHTELMAKLHTRHNVIYY